MLPVYNAERWTAGISTELNATAHVEHLETTIEPCVISMKCF